MDIKVNDKISFCDAVITHEKASEQYVSVKMRYDDGNNFDGWVPIQYRRTGLSLTSNTEIGDYLTKIYDYLDPKNDDKWFADAEKFWQKEKPNAGETKKVFDALKSGNWTCVNCAISNPNWARRFQDLKEMGFTFATRTPVYCPKCGKKSTYIMCIHIPRNTNNEGNGYETWSPELRKKILSVLGNFDAYEGKKGSNLLPDHKFSEIRWDDKTKSENPDAMTYEEIKDKFQLLTNQRNQQKREVCRKCFQTGERPSIFGIDFFYHGGKEWDNSIPKTGKEAEAGCFGCPWYDIETWRESLEEALNEMATKSNEGIHKGEKK